MPNKNQVTIYGRHSVEAALANPRRKISKVFCLRENFNEIKGKIADNKIAVAERRELDKMLPAEAVHQGVAAVAEMLPGISIEEVCSLAEEKENCRLLVQFEAENPGTLSSENLTEIVENLRQS